MNIPVVSCSFVLYSENIYGIKEYEKINGEYIKLDEPIKLKMLLTDDIKGMTAEETREAMKKMFENFEKQTGYKPIIVGNELPTGVLFPMENIKPTEE